MAMLRRLYDFCAETYTAEAGGLNAGWSAATCPSFARLNPSKKMLPAGRARQGLAREAQWLGKKHEHV